VTQAQDIGPRHPGGGSDAVGGQAPASRGGVVVLVVAMLACIAWSALEGPSWSWDRAHYHEYAGHQWVNELLGRGFLPGGPQTFLNPLAFVPRHLLFMAGWSELAIASAVAAFQALCVWLVWLIARDRMPGQAGPAFAAALALLTPVFVSQLGTTYIDATTGVAVLAGVFACRRAGDANRATLAWAALGGLAMGVATGLKLSNAIPALVAPLLFVLASGGAGAGARVALRHRLSALLAFGLAASLGAALALGNWGLALHREYRNPVYPILDGAFNPRPAVAAAGTAPAHDGAVAAPASPSALERAAGLVRASGSRFVPETVGQALTWPLRIADPRLPTNMAYVEWHAPDPRLAILGVLVLALALRTAARSMAGGAMKRFADRPPAARVDAPLLAFFAGWLALWMFSSANGRYGVTLLMLAAVPIAQITLSLLQPERLRIAAIAAIVSLQAVFALVVQDRSDLAGELGWRDAALKVEMPASLVNEPAVHVVISFLSWSYLLPRMHPDSTMVNLASLCRRAECPEGLSVERAASVLREGSGRVRLLTEVNEIHGGRLRVGTKAVAAANHQIAEFDLKVDAERCEIFEVRPNLSKVWLAGSGPAGQSLSKSNWVASCPLVTDSAAAAAAIAYRDRHAAVFRTLERACRRELGVPHGLILSDGDGSWTQLYLDRDIRVRIDQGRVSAMRLRRETRVLGSVEALSAQAAPIDCSALVWSPETRPADGLALLPAIESPNRPH
jgi:hypothetical protein